MMENTACLTFMPHSTTIPSTSVTPALSPKRLEALESSACPSASNHPGRTVPSTHRTARPRPNRTPRAQAQSPPGRQTAPPPRPSPSLRPAGGGGGRVATATAAGSLTGAERGAPAPQHRHGGRGALWGSATSAGARAPSRDADAALPLLGGWRRGRGRGCRHGDAPRLGRAYRYGGQTGRGCLPIPFAWVPFKINEAL